jgi:DNA repair exonuclease SbcCD nuclease subunit
MMLKSNRPEQGTVKIAIVSDAHLFQTFTESYDSVSDFQRAIAQIAADESPDALFLAGDMFDAKKTETMFLRHYEGEGHMIRIREIFMKFGKPIYAIEGNHDRQEILDGLAQTVENFHFSGNSVVTLGEMPICFMNSFYETGGTYEAATIQRMKEFLDQSAAKVAKSGGKPALLCHETFEPYEGAIPASIVGLLKKSFQLVLNGHMHFWKPNSYNSPHIACLPSLLPSKIVKGRYAMEHFEWQEGTTNYEKSETDSPYGYVVLDTESAEVKVRQFVPSKRIVEVTLHSTSLSLEEARRRFRVLLSNLDKRNDKNQLIVLPELKGSLTFSPLYLENVSQEFPELQVEDIRYKETNLVATLGSASLTAPTLTVEQLFAKLTANLPQIVDEIRAKGVQVDEDAASEVLRALLDEELIVKSQAVQQNRTRLQLVLTPVIDALAKSEQKRPPQFEDNLVNLLKMVR